MLPDPASIRVFRKDPETGTGAGLRLDPEEIQVVEFGGGKGVSFPISTFGCYVAAVRRPR